MADNFQYNIGLNINPHTEDAQRQLAKLKSQLVDLNATAMPKVKNSGFKEAQKDVANLKSILDSATNSAGQLDLSKLSTSLIKSNHSLNDFSKSLGMMGSQGQKAWLELNKQIVSAEKPLIRVKGLLDKFADQMIRTTSIQLSYGVLNSFVNTFQHAFEYAQRLDKSLTNIQIVTKQSSAQMKKFAEYANESAKALSVSTTAYTDAALIFYQQGLSDKAVKERTEVTLKMANVSGESAKDISSYMTAIWNNFDDGSKSLEYYADVIAKLGADTAASNAEIAEGMQAFAAVADTVGLSYEYASSALALLVDKTQQSASVIGNSLKTIFGRLSSLQLGDSLEDGVNLSKYTEALNTVGIDIREQNGELMSMDNILNNIGDKWKTLDEQSKIALANTVAGVRQYNNFISLMDNFDDYKDLINSASQATGELNKEQLIYANSWKAARDEVKAAAEGIYQSLIDDEFFTELTRSIAGIIKWIDKFIESMGGMKGIMLTLGILATTVFKEKIAKGLSVLYDEFVMLTAAGKKNVNELQKTALNNVINISNKNQKQEYQQLEKIAGLKQKILEYDRFLTEEQKNRLKVNELSIEKLSQEALILAQESRDSKSQNLAKQGNLEAKLGRNLQGYDNFNNNPEESATHKFNGIVASAGKLAGKAEYMQSLDLDSMSRKERNAVIKSLHVDDFSGLADIPGASELHQELSNNLQAVKKQTTGNNPEEVEDLNNKLEDLYATIRKIGTLVKSGSPLLDILGNPKDAEKIQGILNDSQEEINQVFESSSQAEENQHRATAAQKDFKNAVEGQNKALDDSLHSTRKASEVFIDLAGAGMEATFVMNNLKTALESLADGDITSAFTSLAMTLPTIINLASKLKDTRDANGALVQAGLLTQVKGLTNGAFDSFVGMFTKGFSGMKTSVIGFAKTLKGAILVAGKFLAIIGLIMGALWLLGKAFEMIKNSTPEAKMKAAKEQTASAAAAADEATKAYSALKQKLDEFDNVYDKLNNLTAGTIEWKNAIIETNKQAAELIKQYDLMEGSDYYYDTNGVFRMTKAGRNKTEQAELQKVDNANDAYMASLARESTLTEQAQKRKYSGIAITANAQMIADANNGQSTVYQTNKQAAYNMANQINGFSTNQIDKIVNAMKTGELNLNSDTLAEDLKPIVGELTDEQIKMLGSNSTLRESLIDCATATNSNTAALKAANMQHIDELFDGNDVFDKITNDEREVLSTAYIEDLEAAIAESKYLNYNKGNYNNEQKKEFVEASGWKQDAATGKWTDSAGNEVDFSDINTDNMNYYFAKKDAEAKVDEKYLNMTETERDKTLEAHPGNKLYTKEQIDAGANATEFDYGEGKLDKKLITEYTEQLMKENKALSENANLAREIAVANLNYNDGLGDLIDNHEDYVSVLKTNNRTSADFSETANKVRDDLSKMFNVYEGDITDDFLTNAENLELMERAAQGDLDAISDLQDKLHEDLLLKIDVENGSIAEQKLQEIIGLGNQINDQNFELGISMNDDELLMQYANLMNEMIASGNMTVEEVQKALNSIGFDPEMEYKKYESGMTVAANQTVMVKDENGDYHAQDFKTAMEQKADIYIPTINAKKTTYRGAPPNITSQKNLNKGKGGKPKTKNAIDETERYHVIRKELAAINSELDKIGKAKDRAFGNQKIALMDQEITKYEDLANAQKQYLKEIEGYYNADRNVMAGYGAQFGADGTILNYDQLIKTAVDAYNASGGSEEADKAYEDFKKALSNYEDSVSLLQSENAQLQDYLNSIYDAKLEKLDYKIQVKLDIEDDELEYLEFLLETLEDDTYDVAEAMGYLAEETQNYFNKIEHVKSGISGLFDNHGGNGAQILEDLLTGKADINSLAQQFTFTEAEIDKLRDWVSGLKDWTLQLKELQETINQKVLDSFDNFLEKIDKQIDKIDHLNNVLGSYKNIINLVGKETLKISSELYDRLNDNVMDMSTKQLEISKNEYETAKRAYEDAVAKGLDQKILDELEDRLGEVQENYLSNWESAIQQAQDLLRESLEDIGKEFGKAVSGMAGTLENLQDAYNKKKALDDNYLATYDRMYHLSKLSKEINDSINNSDDIKSKVRLKGLMEEINELQEKDTNLSQYQLDVLQKRYELYLAEIALREAENAKSQVRMVSDSEGNINYMYTADENKVREAENNYNSKLYEYADLNAKQIEDINSRLIANRQQLAEELAKCDVDDKARMEEIRAYYDEQERYLEEQMQAALDANIEVNGYKEASDWDVATNFSDTVFSQVTGYETLGEVQQNWQDSTQQMIEDVAQAYETYQTRYEDVMSAAGVATEEFAGTLDRELSDVEKKSTEAGDTATKMGKDFETAFTKAVNSAATFSQKYAEAINSAIANNGKLINSMNDLIRTLANIGGANISTGKITQLANAAGSQGMSGLYNAIANAENNGGTEETNDGGGGDKGYYLYRYRVTDDAGGVTVEFSDKNKDIAYRKARAEAISRNSSNEREGKWDAPQYRVQNLGSKWVAFLSGGYTGEWGSTGRLAILHQKELVLNAHDTRNILDTVSAVRDLVSRMGSFGADVNLSGAYNLGDLANGSNQNVVINAAFPNAVNHSEIELAFNNLLNRASQYANKK